MMSETLTSTIKDSVRKFLGKYIKQDKFTDDTDLFKAGFVNSLFTVDLIVFIEGTFQFQIDNEDLKMDNFRSVSAIVNLIERKTGRE